MDTVLRGLDCTFVYVDDILVASRSKAEHMVHLRQVLERLQQQGLVINLAKCQFGRHELDFLGHHITKHAATPLPSKVTAIREFTRSSTVKGLQEFVGMVKTCSEGNKKRKKQVKWALIFTQLIYVGQN